MNPRKKEESNQPAPGNGGKCRRVRSGTFGKSMRPKIVFIFTLFIASLAQAKVKDGRWISLFDGATLAGWKASESQTTFSVSEGEIVTHGPRSHLFYVGPVANHDWIDFELVMEVKTSRSANSGVYFHTRFQEAGLPDIGYQVQINNTNPYPSKTASLYGVDDRLTAPIGDGVWFELLIRVEGKRIITKVNGQTICDYIEPKNPERKDEVKGSILAHGTIALQGHDKESETRFRNIRIRSLNKNEPNQAAQTTPGS